MKEKDPALCKDADHSYKQLLDSAGKPTTRYRDGLRYYSMYCSKCGHMGELTRKEK